MRGQRLEGPAASQQGWQGLAGCTPSPALPWPGIDRQSLPVRLQPESRCLPPTLHFLAALVATIWSCVSTYPALAASSRPLAARRRTQAMHAGTCPPTQPPDHKHQPRQRPPSPHTRGHTTPETHPLNITADCPRREVEGWSGTIAVDRGVAAGVGACSLLAACSTVREGPGVGWQPCFCLHGDTTIPSRPGGVGAIVDRDADRRPRGLVLGTRAAWGATGALFPTPMARSYAAVWRGARAAGRSALAATWPHRGLPARAQQRSGDALLARRDRRHSPLGP